MTKPWPAILGNNIAEAIKPNLPWWNRQKEAGILGFEEPPAHYVIPELNNVRRHFTIQAALEKRGYSSAQVEKIMGKNWRRVLTDSLG
jgi:microsomal dipeptidase-like Zn-dependent dipeptidase